MSSILSLVNQHKNTETGFAIYRWPSEISVNYCSGPDSDKAGDGFTFTSFDTKLNKPLFLSIKDRQTAESFTELINELAVKSSDDSSLGNSNEVDTLQSKYNKGFESIQSDIQDGVIQKAILSRKITASYKTEDLDQLFENTLNSHPSAMVYCFYHPTSGLWIGASPELILRQEGNKYKTTSLAGTKSSEDTAWRQKELDEQKIVTNFITNNLNSINSKFTLGNLETVKAGNIYHLKQLIEFELTKGNLIEVVNKLHPTPAIGGYPKEEAYNSIKKSESHSREYYCGYLGEVNDDNSRLYVNLRCIRIYDNQIQIFVGGGITKDSILEDEWEECNRKASGYLSML